MNEHRDKARNILDSLNSDPDELVFHYVRAVLCDAGGNVSEAARRMKIERRSAQRLLMKKDPQETLRQAAARRKKEAAPGGFGERSESRAT